MKYINNIFILLLQLKFIRKMYMNKAFIHVIICSTTVTKLRNGISIEIIMTILY